MTDPTETPPDLDHIAPDLRPLAVPIGDLTLDPRNARAHDARNVKAIAESLRRFGYRSAIVCQRRPEGLMVRAGEGRIEASRLLGHTHVPVLAFEEDDHEAMAFALADNKTGELSSWDYEALADVVRELNEAEPEALLDIGFLQSEIDVLSQVEFKPPEVPQEEYEQPQGQAPASGAELTVVLRGEAARRLAAAAEAAKVAPDALVLQLLDEGEGE
jgi:ParB-like chromosome segregation protein Spo0J